MQAHFDAVLNTGTVPTKLKEVSLQCQHRAN
jgi:hypothetical protein